MLPDTDVLKYVNFFFLFYLFVFFFEIEGCRKSLGGPHVAYRMQVGDSWPKRISATVEVGLGV